MLYFNSPPLKEITPEQISLIQNEWDFVKSQSVDILYNFFDKFPGNQKQFKVNIYKFKCEPF